MRDERWQDGKRGYPTGRFFYEDKKDDRSYSEGREAEKESRGERLTCYPKTQEKNLSGSFAVKTLTKNDVAETVVGRFMVPVFPRNTQFRCRATRKKTCSEEKGGWRHASPIRSRGTGSHYEVKGRGDEMLYYRPGGGIRRGDVDDHNQRKKQMVFSHGQRRRHKTNTTGDTQVTKGAAKGGWGAAPSAKKKGLGPHKLF